MTRLPAVAAIAASLLFAVPSSAEEPHAVPPRAPIAHGGYGAPSMKLTWLAGNPTLLAGGEGGWVIGHSFVVGGAGYASALKGRAPGSLQPPGGGADLGIAYGGLRLGGIIAADKTTHATIGLLLGGGEVRSETSRETFRRNDFYIVEADLAAEVNVARHVRVGFGGSYRLIATTGTTVFTSTTLAGPAVVLTLRIGEF